MQIDHDFTLALHCKVPRRAPSGKPFVADQLLYTVRLLATIRGASVTDHYHALVWIDHREARVFQFNATDAERSSIRSSHPDQHIHHKANAGDSGHAPVDKEFLERISTALSHAGAILITGPANAKTELAQHIKQTHPTLGQRISGVETLDHPSDGELLALARKFFKGDDRMHSQTHR
ncbi:MAG TPA: hypothetical protein VGH84_09580 [Steroidobacteraceae bacterium]